MNLQQVTEELATELARPVLVIGLDESRLASSNPDASDGSNHVVVPIRGGSGPLAFFWLDAEGQPPLSASDFSLIDAGAGIARDLLTDDPAARPGSTRELTMAHLLDDDPAVRRAAFADAVTHRWIDRGGRTVVRALLVDEAVGGLQQVSLGRHLAARTPSHTTFIRERDSVVYLVTRDGRTDNDLDRWIRDESTRVGVPVVAIGSAHHDPASDDLFEAAAEARIAADLTAALPELQPASSIEELGGWVMLQSVSASPRRLADISPAADILCRAGDALQRQTIETYLDAGGQARTACERLHIHRTTLYYRLDNMPEVVKDALADGMKRSTLHLALKLIRYWEASGAI